MQSRHSFGDIQGGVVIPYITDASLSTLVSNFSRLASLRGGPFDLILFVGYQIADQAEFRGHCDAVARVPSASQTRTIFAIQHLPAKIGTRRHGQCEIVPFEDFFHPIKGRLTIDRVLDAYSAASEPRVRVADSDLGAQEVRRRAVPQYEVAVLDRLRTSHVFGVPDEFTKAHVAYSTGNIATFDDEIDRLLDPQYKHLDSVAEFHTVLSKNPGRVTHLLLGHRGCGKSSFLHYYYPRFEEFRRLKQPFVIVDFLNYGYVGDAVNLPIRIIRLIHRELIRSGPAELIREYPTLTSLYPPEAMEILIAGFQEAGIPFATVIPEDISYEITRTIEPIGEIHLGRMIAGDNALDEFAARNLCGEALQSRPWIWLKHAWQYLNGDSDEKPLRYFANWVLTRSFENKPRIQYASSDMIRKGLSSWAGLHIPDGLPRVAAYKVSDLEDLVTSFVRAASEEWGVMHVILDNIDQLASTYAEYRMMWAVYRHLARVYERLKIVVSVRPSTYYAHRGSFDKEMIPDDAAAYYKHWLQKVRLGRVLEHRLQALNADEKETDTKTFLGTLTGILKLPILRSRYSKDDGTRLADVVEGLTGNNVRDGLELFSSFARSWRTHLTEKGALGLLRTAQAKNEYIAEHIAIRALFLQEEGRYEFRNGLLNLFHVDGLPGHHSTLLQPRILELLRALRVTSLASMYSSMKGLGYPEAAVAAAITQLQHCRLISIDPYNAALLPPAEGARVMIRYRGVFYYERLAHKLSYIQMVYFMTPLPSSCARRLSFPHLPGVATGELADLIENFLHALWCDIASERRAATPEGLTAFETVAGPLDRLHLHVSDIYNDLQNILDSRED